MICEECREKNKKRIVCQVFTTFVCEACNRPKQHYNSGVPRICNECACTLNKCQYCKKEMTYEN